MRPLVWRGVELNVHGTKVLQVAANGRLYQTPKEPAESAADSRDSDGLELLITDEFAQSAGAAPDILQLGAILPVGLCGEVDEMPFLPNKGRYLSQSAHRDK
jgi:hypothetical protein